MWMGTLDGLVRYDGHRLKIYRNQANDSTSLSNNIVRALYEDTHGVLWIGTSGGGLNRFDPATEQFTHYTHNPDDSTSIPHNRVRTIVEDARGYLWIGTDGGLARFHPPTETFVRISLPTSPDRQHRSIVWSLSLDAQGHVWGGILDMGLFRLTLDAQGDVVNQTLYTRQAAALPTRSLQDDWVWSICQDPKGLLWMATNKGVSRFDPTTETFQHFPSQQLVGKELGAWFVKFDAQQRLWIGTDGGGLLVCENYADVQPVFQQYQHQPAEFGSLTDNKVFSFYADTAANTLWFGTLDNGVSLLAGVAESFHYYGLPRENRKITCLTPQADTLFWIATELGGPKQFSTSGRLLQTLELPIMQGVRTESILYDTRYNVLWLGTRNGLFAYDMRTGETIHLTANHPTVPLVSDWVVSLAQDAEGAVWAGTLGGGISVLRRTMRGELSARAMRPQEDGLHSGTVWVVRPMRNGTYWIGTERGVTVYNPTTNRFRVLPGQQQKGGLLNNYVTSIAEDEHSSVWVGTLGGGLHRFMPEDSTFLAFTKEDGLSSDIVHSIIPDQEKNLWLSLSNGIVKFTHAQQTHKAPSFQTYTHRGILKGAFASRNVGLRLANNDILFGGADGLVRFSPEALDQVENPAPIVFTDLKLFNQSVLIGAAESPLQRDISLTDSLSLAHDQNVLTVEFALLSYVVSSKNTYAFRLENFDTSWNYVNTQQVATYTNLSPGTYLLRVKAADYRGEWSQQEARLHLEIRSPWWATVWAYAAYTFFLLTVGPFLYISRVNKLKKYQRTLEAEVAERTQRIGRQNVALWEQSSNLRRANQLLNAKNAEIQLKNERIHASLTYAKTIQVATLPSLQSIKAIFPHSFVFFKPLELVSGDIYWFADLSALSNASQMQQKVLVASIDCTGHGVPGAFMSMKADALLHEIVFVKGITQAHSILEELHKSVRLSLKQYETGNTDGMDVGVCIFHKNEQGKFYEAEFAGARSSLIYVEGNDLKISKGSRLSIGGIQEHSDMERSYTSQHIPLRTTTTFYLFSDGYSDQFGGIARKKFMLKRFRALLHKIAPLPTAEQHAQLEQTLAAWMQAGDEPQVDDILVVGIQLTPDMIALP